MEKIKITKVSATNLKKDGTPILTHFGKPAWRVGIQTEQYGQTWINGFLPFSPIDWEGKEMELSITEKEWNGQMQKNFELPKKDDKVIEMLSELLTKVGRLNANVEYLKDKLVVPATEDHTAIDPETGIDLNDNPPF